MATHLLAHVGGYFIMLKKTFARPEKFSVFWKQFIWQCTAIGIRVIPLILIISIFLGMVMALQAAYMLDAPLVPPSIVGFVIRDIMILELAPTGVAAILAGVTGYKVSAELAYMRLYEQTDALEVMGINSTSFLVLPIILASMVTIPCLVILCLFISIVSSLLYSYLTGIVGISDFVMGLRQDFHPFNIVVTITKAIVFSFLISSVAAYVGHRARGNSYELSRASVRAIIAICIVVILVDYILTKLMLPIYK